MGMRRGGTYRLMAHMGRLLPALRPAPRWPAAPAARERSRRTERPTRGSPPPTPVCPNADRRPQRRADERSRAAIACLLAAERAARDLVALERDEALAEAAQSHSDDMAWRSYFAHRSPEADDAGDRAGAAGYTPRPPETWVVGENLGYGSGRLATPRRMMRGWMQSDGHRANILREQHRDIGVGIALGRPGQDRPRGAIVTTVFGRRSARLVKCCSPRTGDRLILAGGPAPLSSHRSALPRGAACRGAARR